MEEIEENINHPEVIFYEGDSSSLDKQTIRAHVSIVPVAPLLGFAVLFQVYALIELGGRLFSLIDGKSAGRDEDIVNNLKERYGITSKEVDLDLLPYIQEHRLFWIVSNWGLLILIYWITRPVASSNFYGFVMNVAVASYVILLLFLGWVHPVRNRHMAQQISNEIDDYYEACLVTGSGHHAAVGRILHEESDVEVINPQPEDPSYLTRFSMAVMGVLLAVRSYFINRAFEASA